MYESQKNETDVKGIFTEQQRAAVRKKLLGYAQKKKQSLPNEPGNAKKAGKKRSAIPLLVEQEFHTNFNMQSYRSELDEVPYLLLFRTHFLPYYENKEPIEMEALRHLAEMSGMQGTMIEEEANGYRLTGEIARGGAVRQIAFYLQHHLEGKRMVTIRNIVFTTTQN